MQVFIPYTSPIKVARCLDQKRLHKQVIECHQIMEAILGTRTRAFGHHPVVFMYQNHINWLEEYTQCLEAYIKYYKAPIEEKANLYNQAKLISFRADTHIPIWLTPKFCRTHQKRLYEKDPVHYQAFEEVAKSFNEDTGINRYIIKGEVKLYLNGKLIGTEPLINYL